MSIAGRVLSVCVTLLLLLWLCLFAMVARRNSNWGEKIKKQEATIASLTEEVAKAAAEVDKAKRDLSLAQELTDKDVIVLRSEIADLEEALTNRIETLERVKNQLTGQQSAEQATQVAKKRREDEKAQTEKLLAAAKDEVEELKKVDGTLRDTKQKLEADFQALLLENQRLIGIQKVSN
jgi:chromosome segregation ATPase